MNYSTYLFDFDGTLVDSMPAYISAMLKILDENNVSYGNDIVKIITPLGYAGTAKYYKEQFGLDMAEDDILKLMNQYAYEEYAYNIPAKPNVIETLKKLKESGAQLNVLTASPHTVLDICLQRLGMFELFDNVWSCDDFEKTKADPNIYTEAAKRLEKPVSSILFLDDNYNACKTAKTADMKVCGVFDASSENYADEINSVADYYIYDFVELCNCAFAD